MGNTDKAIRVLIAIVFAALYFTKIAEGTLGIVLLILAIAFLLTAFISFCPVYLPFGINTCKKDK